MNTLLTTTLTLLAPLMCIHAQAQYTVNPDSAATLNITTVNRMNIQPEWTSDLGTGALSTQAHVGIGNAYPSEKLQVNGNIAGKVVNGQYSNLYRFGGLYFTWDSDSYGTNTQHSIRSTYGNSYGDDLTINSFDHIRLNIDTNNNNANSYFEVGHHTTHTDGTLFRIVSPTGNVGIGTASPDEKLTVKGNIHAEEVKVDLSVPGPDYVFEEGYDLPALKELEAFIKARKHLPEVPSAQEIENQGQHLGAMNMLLLKKIEELTLYAIAQEKALEEEKAKSTEAIKELLKRIEHLEKEKGR